MAKSSTTRKIGKGLLIALVVILALECLARIGNTVLDDITTDTTWYMYSAELGWDRRPGFSGIAEGAYREFDEQGFISADTEQVQNRGDPTIIILGDSRVFGTGVSVESTFVEYLDRSLPDASVINLGVPGYSSFQGLRQLLECGFDLDPSLIVVAFGMNDRRYVLHEEDADSVEHFVHMEKTYRMNSRIVRVSEKIYLSRAIGKVLEWVGIIGEHGGSIGGGSVDIDTLYPRVPPESFRDNLSAIADEAKERGIPLVFVSFNDNPIHTEHLTNGIAYLNDSLYDLAAVELEKAVELDNWASTIARKYLAEAYESQGLSEEASDALIISKPLISTSGGNPLYLDTEYNVIIRDVAEEYEATYVDAGSVLDEEPVFYVDDCHFDATGHKKVAHELYLAIVSNGLLAYEAAGAVTVMPRT